MKENKQFTYASYVISMVIFVAKNSPPTYHIRLVVVCVTDNKELSLSMLHIWLVWLLYKKETFTDFINVE